MARCCGGYTGQVWTGLLAIALILGGLPMLAVVLGRRSPRRAPAEPARGLGARYDLSVAEVHAVIAAVDAGRLPAAARLAEPARDLARRMIADPALVGQRRVPRWVRPMLRLALVVALVGLVIAHRWDEATYAAIYVAIWGPTMALTLRQQRQHLCALREIAAGESGAAPPQ